MSAAGASRSPPPPPASVRLPVQAIVVNRALFQQWIRAGYNVAWELPLGTPMYDCQDSQHIFGYVGLLMPPPQPPADLTLSRLPPSTPGDFPGPVPSRRGSPMSSLGVATGGSEEGGEGSPYRPPSPPSRVQSAGPRAGSLPPSARPRSAPPLPAFLVPGLVLPPAALSPTSPAPSTPHQPWPETAPPSSVVSSSSPSLPAMPTPAPSPSPALSTSTMSASSKIFAEEPAAAEEPVTTMEPECHVDEPEDEGPPPSAKNKGKKPVCQVTDADEPYISDSSANLFVSPPSPPSPPIAEQQPSQVEFEPEDEQWEEYSAEKWERATPADQPTTSDRPLPIAPPSKTVDDMPANKPASSGYSLPGASLSNAVHAMPRLPDLVDNRTVEASTDVDDATTIADDDESDPGPDVQLTDIDWAKIYQQKPMDEWSVEEAHLLGSILSAQAARQVDERVERRRAEMAQNLQQIKELRQKRLREISAQNGEGAEEAPAQKEEVAETEDNKTQPLTRNQKRALKKKEAAAKKKAEKKQVEEEAKRKAAADKGAPDKTAHTVPKSKDTTQQPIPAVQRVGGRRVIKKRPTKPKQEETNGKIEVEVTQETTVTEECVEQSGESSSSARQVPNVVETTGGQERRSLADDSIYANFLRRLVQNRPENLGADSVHMNQPRRRKREEDPWYSDYEHDSDSDESDGGGKQCETT